MTTAPEPTAAEIAETFRQIIRLVFAALRYVPKPLRDGWVAELGGRVDARRPLTAAETLVLCTLMGPGLSMREAPGPPVGVDPGPAGGLVAWTLFPILAHLVAALVVVPAAVRLAFLDELQVRAQVGEFLTEDEWGIVQTLIGLPCSEMIAAAIRQQEPPTLG